MAADRPATTVRKTSIPGNLVRGALIGTVETVPGVSGGTVALVVGIYRHIIDSAGHIVSAGRKLVTGPNRGSAAAVELRRVHWKVVIPTLIGMVVALAVIAGPMATLVDAHPQLMRATFFGMVLASTIIPLRMAGLSGAKPAQILLALVAAVLTFWLVSIPPTSVTPTPAIIVAAGAVAVCALLLPGLSGSFLLLTLGLYEPTLHAVSDRDFGYLGLFFAGCVIGVVALIKGLQWLLAHRTRVTLIVLTGVMVGALRALWPWQGEGRELLAPADNWGVALLLAAGGFVLVAVLAAVDARLVRKQMA